jgi:hypothetical protein
MATSEGNTSYPHEEGEDCPLLEREASQYPAGVRGRTMAKTKEAGQVYQLKITQRDMEPPI